MDNIAVFENVIEMFKSVNCIGQQNNFFVANKDISKGARANGIVAGQAVAGSAGFFIGEAIGESIEKKASDLNKHTLFLINQTENGLGIIPLIGGSPFSSYVKPEKIKPVYEDYIFYSYNEIKDITVKNFNLLNTKVQSIIITFADDNKVYLIANVKEKFLPYHESNFARFMQLYKK